MGAFEKHYTVREIAARWGLSDDTIRKIFRNEKGVLRNNGVNGRIKGKRWQMLIPESVLQRVYTRLVVK
jgi:predicted transcriptional regulator